MMMGVWAVGPQLAKSRRTPQCAISARTRSDAGSPFILAMGNASQPRYARTDRTLPHVPPAQDRTGVFGSRPRTRSRAIRPVPNTFGFLTEVIREALLLRATPAVAQDKHPLPAKCERDSAPQLRPGLPQECTRWAQDGRQANHVR